MFFALGSSWIIAQTPGKLRNLSHSSSLWNAIDIDQIIRPLFEESAYEKNAFSVSVQYWSNLKWDVSVIGTGMLVNSSLRRGQSNPLVYTVCVLVHDILFQIPLSRKDIYSRFWLVKTIVWPNTRQKQANQKRLYISMRLGGIWNKISCTNTQTVKTTVWHKQTACSAG